MKTIKAITDFGIKEVPTVGTKKEIRNTFWIVAKVPVQYMNASEPMILRRLIHFETGTNLPIRVGFKDTQRAFFEAAETFLKSISDNDIKQELSKYKIIN